MAAPPCPVIVADNSSLPIYRGTTAGVPRQLYEGAGALFFRGAAHLPGHASQPENLFFVALRWRRIELDAAFYRVVRNPGPTTELCFLLSYTSEHGGDGGSVSVYSPV